MAANLENLRSPGFRDIMGHQGIRWRRFCNSVSILANGRN